MKTDRWQQMLPPWVLPVVILVSVLAFVFFGWRTLTATGDAAGPPKEVHAGMYDLRQEVAKMRAAHNGAQSGGR